MNGFDRMEQLPAHPILSQRHQNPLECRQRFQIIMSVTQQQQQLQQRQAQMVRFRFFL